MTAEQKTKIDMALEYGRRAERFIAEREAYSRTAQGDERRAEQFAVAALAAHLVCDQFHAFRSYFCLDAVSACRELQTVCDWICQRRRENKPVCDEDEERATPFTSSLAVIAGRLNEYARSAGHVAQRETATRVRDTYNEALEFARCFQTWKATAEE